MFYTLPLSLKILLNLCLELSCKQETAGKIYTELNKNSSHSNKCSIFSLTSVSLILQIN